MTGPISRLSEPWGIKLDRGTDRVRFYFDGAPVTGFAGDTIASAVLSDPYAPNFLARSFKYHRPRSLLLGNGMDANVYVCVDGTPNLPADTVQIEPGMKVTSQNTFGGLKQDWGRLLGGFSRFLPAGFYYDAFFRPKGVWPFWEKIIRRLAGLGEIKPGLDAKPARKKHLFCDVAVIGGGLAGLKAALTAADRGYDVLLLEQDGDLGGAALSDRLGRVDRQQLSELIERVRSHPYIQCLTDTQCSGWFTGNLLTAHGRQVYYHIRAQKIIVATGVVEQPLVFRNNDLPGVYLGSAVQRYLHNYGVCLAKNVVIQTANRFGYELALKLSKAGVNVVTVLDMRRTPGEMALVETCEAKGIPVRFGETVIEANPGSGSGLRNVVVQDLIGSNATPASQTVTACESLITCVGFMPQSQLVCHSGGEMVYDEAINTFRISACPKHGFICGTVNGVFDFDAVLRDAERASEAAMSELSSEDNKTEFETIPAEAMTFPITAYKHEKGREFVDFDEDQTIGDIETALAAGFEHMELVKRYTTIGMGPSQGRTTSLNAIRLVSSLTGTPLSSLKVTTQRPPAAPESISNLAAGLETPIRRTAIDDWHEAQGATWMPSGNWRRPAFYGAPNAETSSVEAEIQAVHDAVGLIDVSTLGGIVLRGPDAIDLMNRTYIGSFNKMAVGTTRYLVMCDELGAVVDDGVACRISEDKVYLSTASTRSAATFEEMLRLRIENDLDVSIVNVTGSKSVFNLAGPKARAAIQALNSDLDFSAEAFPFLAFREGHLGGAPVLIARQGFVGELSYEIHVDSQFARPLWDALMTVGDPYGIRPFGVLAQRHLRLEKAHIIVGQDTDFLTNPDHVHLSKMVKMKAGPFVGRAAIATLRQRPPSQTLVNVKGAPGRRDVPAEGQLIYSGEQSVGRVTSSTYSHVSECAIGLALIETSTSKTDPLKTLQGEEEIELFITDSAFYDPGNERQKL